MTDETSRKVRIRGIYTTALTHLCLEHDWTVVDASGPIERRFEADFETAAPDATIETADDRQGVGIAGKPEAVDELVKHSSRLESTACSGTTPHPWGRCSTGG